ncbi:MAG: UvrD-helicase domain-containing protein [Patescibacteria group bacterium]
MHYLEELNEAQRRAVEKTEGPLLILAGAGAGKTKTITHRILHLIKNGVAPQNILAVTFTNKAAREMHERIEKLITEDLSINKPVSIFSKPFVSTFHGLGAFIIKENFREVGIKKHFSIYDKADSKRIVKESMLKNGYNPKEIDPAKILSIISREKGNFVSQKDYSINAGGYFEDIVSSVWEDYEESLKKENALDFDDLLLVSAKLLEKESVRKIYIDRWHYIHIDEYQDTNKVQYKMALALTGDKQNICVVGDVDQNIYSWRGANIKNILNFEKDFPKAQTILLEENYRSTQTILAIANRIIERNKHRQEKKLVTRNALGDKLGIFEALTENHEAQFIVEKVKELRSKGVPLADMAVLYRANFQSRVLEEEFLTGNIEYHVLGTRFFERKEVKDILAFLRYSFNPESISDLKRIINVPPRGIGKTTLLKIVEGKEEDLPPTMKIKMHYFRELLSKIKHFAITNLPSKTITFIAEETGLNNNLDKSEEGKERIENIKELSVLASRYNSLPLEEGIEKLLEDTSLASDQDSDKKENPGVRLMTVHAAKGLEFGYVFITGLEEGLFPHDRNNDENVSEEEAEEERRLFYVALTRAKKKIFLSYAQSRTIFGSRGSNIPSEFLLEIPDEYLEREFLDYTPKHKPLLHIEF